LLIGYADVPNGEGPRVFGRSIEVKSSKDQIEFLLGSPSDYRSVSGKIIATRTNRTNEESGFPIGLYCCLAVPRIGGYAFAGNPTRMGINFVIYAMTH